MSRTILHIDMDAFFASVEQLDQPQWRGRPVIVGGQERGVVSAASYEARHYGIRSAMPVGEARRRCPHGIFTRPRVARYKELSGMVMDILATFSPILEKTSVDEAYLDVTGTERLFGPPQELGARIKADIREATGLNCSVGIAPCRFLAKIGSDWNKPDGLFVLHEEEVADFVAALPVGKVPGIGPKQVEKLKRLGVKVLGDVTRLSETFWRERLGDKGGTFLWQRAHGVDPSPVGQGGGAKSVSAEQTFFEPIRDPEEMERVLYAQAEKVGTSVRAEELAGRTVTLKVRFPDFTTLTRSRTLERPTRSTRRIFEAARELLQAETGGRARSVRLLGVGLSGFDEGTRVVQASLFDVTGEVAGHKRGASAGTPMGEQTTTPDESVALEQTVDAIRQRFGRGALTTGRLFRPLSQESGSPSEHKESS